MKKLFANEFVAEVEKFVFARSDRRERRSNLLVILSPAKRGEESLFFRFFVASLLRMTYISEIATAAFGSLAMTVRRQTPNKRGVVLILTFIIMAALTAITTSFLYMTSVQLKSGGYDVASHKALWLAEAGIQKVLYKLKTDSAYRASPTAVSGSLGGGSYSVTVSKNSTTYTIVSTGTVSVLNRKIQETTIAVELPEAFGYVLFAGDDIKTNGASNLVITGSQKQSATNLPTVDFSYYQSNASPGQSISGAYTFNAGTYSGIWYITDNVTIKSNVTVNGTVVTEKKITCSNRDNVTISSASPNPALIARDNIDFGDSEDVTINGLIYAGADGSGNMILRDTEDVNIIGTVIAANDIRLQDSEEVTITYNSSIVSNSPPGISGTGGQVTVSPQKDWNEITPAV